MKSIRLVVLAVTTLVSGYAYADLPHIMNLTVNPTPPAAKVGVAFLNIHNPNSTPITLSKVSSPAISRIELHLSEITDDVAKMRKLESIEIAADENFAFKHGGYHIMLMDLEGPLFPGDVIPLVFHTDQGDVAVEARVAEKIALPQDSMEGMSHGEKEHGTATDHNTKHDG